MNCWWGLFENFGEKIKKIKRQDRDMQYKICYCNSIITKLKKKTKQGKKKNKKWANEGYLIFSTLNI